MPTDHNSSTAGGQLSPYLKAIRRRWLLIVATTVIAAGVAVALGLSFTKEYQATAKVFVNQTNPVQNIVGQNQQPPQDVERDLNSKVALIKLEAVAERVKRRLHLDIATQDLLDKVETQIEGTTEIVDITATDKDPRRAAAIANAFSTEFVAARQRSARGTIEQAVVLAQQQLDSLTPDERAAPQGRELTNQLRQLQIAAALQTGGIEVASPASVPSVPSGPKIKRNAVLAGILGLLLAVGIAVAVEATDRRIKDEEELEAFESPILATIPRGRNGRSAGDDFAVREALSTLATNLRFFQLGRDVSTMIITSPGPREGKTTTTLGLSRALAQLGIRVLTIECDLRRPTVAEYTGLAPLGGLSTVLAGVSDFDSEVVDIDAETLRPIDGPDPSRPWFSVLPAGPVPPNPQGLLSSPAMGETVRRARELADVVLLDTAPVGTVSDVVTLADLVDGIALLVRLNQTRRDGLQRALRTLGNIPTPVLGFVVTDAPRGSSSYYGYDTPPAPAGRTVVPSSR